MHKFLSLCKFAYAKLYELKAVGEMLIYFHYT